MRCLLCLIFKFIFNAGTNTDYKSDPVSEKGSAISVEVSSSVRFAKKVTIESTATASPKVRKLIEKRYKN